jgi:HAD superfamily hydrolase (TIGR01509 family)
MIERMDESERQAAGDPNSTDSRVVVLRREALGSFIEQYDALLFDLDGTLVDTMPLHYQAYAEVLAQRGLRITEADFMSAIGEPARKAIPRFLKLAGIKTIAASEIASIHEEKKQVFMRSLKTARLIPLEAASLLMAAKGRRKIGLVSSGNRLGVIALINAMKWDRIFDVIISGDDVTKGKPDPEPYLAAAAFVGVGPKNCLVLEDTKSGLEAGAAAGMTVLDVTRLKLSNGD